MGIIHPLNNNVPDYNKVIPCSCKKDIILSERRDNLLKYCELPPMASDMTFEKFIVYPEVKEAYDTAKRIATNPKELAWVTFMSGNDTGKTHLAVSICLEWIKHGVAAKYTFVPLLLDELREGFQKHSEDGYEARFKRFCNAPLLVLDDLGAESATNWVQEKLETLVDYRYMNQLSLVVTTNKSIDELSPRLGSRLVRHPQAELVSIVASEYTMRKKVVRK